METNPELLVMLALCTIANVAPSSDSQERAGFKTEDGRREIKEITSYVTQRCALWYSLRFSDFVGLPHMYWGLVACVNVVTKTHESANNIAFVHI